MGKKPRDDNIPKTEPQPLENARIDRKGRGSPEDASGGAGGAVRSILAVRSHHPTAEQLKHEEKD